VRRSREIVLDGPPETGHTVAFERRWIEDDGSVLAHIFSESTQGPFSDGPSDVGDALGPFVDRMGDGIGGAPTDRVVRAVEVEQTPRVSQSFFRPLVTGYESGERFGVSLQQMFRSASRQLLMDANRVGVRQKVRARRRTELAAKAL
jgi:hypothetical protein